MQMGSELGEQTERQSDLQLLKLFQRSRDQDAFTTLVERHHGMVFGVAKRMLGCRHAAEDVVQATFLVLAKDARKIRKRGSLASWLYGIAYRISARSAKKRARATVLSLKDEVMVSADPLENISAQSEQNAVLEELQQLPENTRTPMVLRYLQEQSNAEVAEAMSLSESAVEGRLKRGRHQLRVRLARQGVAFSFVLSVLESIQQEAAATEIPQLVEKTVETCLTGTGTSIGSLGGEPFQLAQQELVKMVTTKIMNGVLVASLALGTVAGGWGLHGDANLLAQNADDDLFGGEAIAEVDSGLPDSDPFGGVSTSAPQADDDPFGAAPPSRNSKKNIQPLQPNPAALDDDGFGGEPVNSNSKKTIAERMRAVGEYGIADDTEAYVRITEARHESTKIECNYETLAHVVSVISERHGIPILFDATALKDENTDPSNDLVSIDVANIKLHNAMTLLLDDLNLTTVIRNEVLMVTSKERAENELSTRTYRIDENWKLTATEILEMIVTMAQPDSWSAVGGPGAIQSIKGGVVVSNSQITHRKISKILAQLDQLYTSNSTAK